MERHPWSSESFQKLLGAAGAHVRGLRGLGVILRNMKRSSPALAAVLKVTRELLEISANICHCNFFPPSSNPISAYP